ncbi:F-box and leucine-rich repeat protein 13-like [Arctopsyche grandis]|uniref:F-box and leucine-rich repeat protein 13-like n=1 Tax=Arctopsyche grandis TaxID=121162 RepID=UPI00406D6BEC
MNIDDLPPEILSEIFSHLSFEDIIIAQNVSHRWNHIFLNSTIWHNINVTCDSDKANYLDLITKICDYADLIKNITIRGMKSEGSINSLMQNCTELNKMHMIMCRFNESTIHNVRNLKNLTVLWIKNCYVLKKLEGNQDWDIDFSALTNLKNLLLSDFGLSDRNFDGLLLCDKIVYLDIRKIKNVSQDNIRKILAQSKTRLKALGLYGGESYNDLLMEYISECSKLKSLSILRCDNLTDKSLVHLNKINPVKLELWNNNNFTDKSLYGVFSNEKWSDLEYLSLSKIRHVTKETLKLLSVRCTKLQFIGLYRCPELSTNELNLNELFPSVMIFYEGG